MEGCTTEPPHDALYAEEPVGVATIIPSPVTIEQKFKPKYYNSNNSKT
jgi:hypothetical protein